MKHKTLGLSWTLLSMVGMVAALSLAFQPAAPAMAAAPNLGGTWHRLNAYPGGPLEHEVLRCGGDSSPVCIYDKQPEPGLDFPNPPDSTFGFFRGQDVTPSWVCPDLFIDTGVCDNVLFVARGVMTYDQSGGTQLVVDHDLIVTVMDGQTRLYVYWSASGFACPWFRSFDEALDANPGWPAGDCIPS